MENNDFIESLSRMTPEEVNKFIYYNGKPPKVIPAIIYDNIKIMTGQYNNKKEQNNF